MATLLLVATTEGDWRLLVVVSFVFTLVALLLIGGGDE